MEKEILRGDGDKMAETTKFVQREIKTSINIFKLKSPFSLFSLCQYYRRKVKRQDKDGAFAPTYCRQSLQTSGLSM